MATKTRISRLRSGHAEQRWIDQHLATGLSTPAVALISYQEPCVIYGRRTRDHEAAQGRAASLDYAVTQRRSGGGVVLAGPWMLGLNVLLPADHPRAAFSHVPAFNWFGSCWQLALAELDIITHLATPYEFHLHQALVHQHGLDWACFAGISHGELLDVDGRKVLGLAQYRGRWGVLLSAGLLIEPTPWEQLEFINSGTRPECSVMHQLTASTELPIALRGRFESLLLEQLAC